MLRWRMNLSVSPDRLARRHALVGPLALGAGPVGERVALVGVDPVGLLGVLAGAGPLVEVGVPAALVAGERVGVVVDLGDGGDRALEERPVVRHDHQRRVQPEDEPLQPVEAVEVEVVGGLVEQEHVEAGEQQGGELGPGGLAAGQPAELRSRAPAGQAEVGGDRGDAGVEVGAAERHPAVERGGVARRWPPRRRRRERGGGGVEAADAAGDAGRRASMARTVSPGRGSGSWGR